MFSPWLQSPFLQVTFSFFHWLKFHVPCHSAPELPVLRLPTPHLPAPPSSCTPVSLHPRLPAPPVGGELGSPGLGSRALQPGPAHPGLGLLLRDAGPAASRPPLLVGPGVNSELPDPQGDEGGLTLPLGRRRGSCARVRGPRRGLWPWTRVLPRWPRDLEQVAEPQRPPD